MAPEKETKEEWQERIRSIGFVNKFKAGASVKKPVENQEVGGNAGYHVEHYDGSQDAVVQPKPVELKLTKEGN